MVYPTISTKCLQALTLTVNTNIARGTTDPGCRVYNLNNFSDWNQFDIRTWTWSNGLQPWTGPTSSSAGADADSKYKYKYSQARRFKSKPEGPTRLLMSSNRDSSSKFKHNYSSVNDNLIILIYSNMKHVNLNLKFHLCHIVPNSSVSFGTIDHLVLDKFSPFSKFTWVWDFFESGAVLVDAPMHKLHQDTTRQKHITTMHQIHQDTMHQFHQDTTHQKHITTMHQ